MVKQNTSSLSNFIKKSQNLSTLNGPKLKSIKLFNFYGEKANFKENLELNHQKEYKNSEDPLHILDILKEMKDSVMNKFLNYGKHFQNKLKSITLKWDKGNNHLRPHQLKKQYSPNLQFHDQPLLVPFQITICFS